MLSKVLLAFIASVIASLAMADAVVVEDPAAHAAKLELLRDDVAAIYAKVRVDDANSLVTILDATDRNSTLDAAVRDYLLETGILALSATSQTPAARASVEQFRNRAVNSLIRLAEGHGKAVVPLYDVAAAARLTGRIWDEREANTRVSLALNSRQWTPATFLQAPAGMTVASWQKGTRQAFAVADRQLLLEQKEALLNASRNTNQYDDLLLVVAKRFGDTGLYKSLFANASPRVSLEAVNSVNDSLPSDAAAETFIAATGRAEVASAAILELGKLAPPDSAARDWLLHRLGHERDGGSAALALARIVDDDILRDIRSIIESDAPELQKLRAVLVLRIDDSIASRTLRHEMLTLDPGSERLREALE